MNIYNYLESKNNIINNMTIKEGDFGNLVIILQAKLKRLGYYNNSITGNFDNYTKNAVISFQKDNVNIPDGIVNNGTWQTLYQLTNESTPYSNETRPTLRLGSTGIYVTELQNLLTNLLYYNGVVDGVFGSGTETSVKTFQLNNHLTTDGIVGRDTWSALFSLYSPLAICDEENNNNNIIYTVVAGDTLWAIARRFNTTVAAIKRLNNLTSDNLNIGQQLLIPVSGGSIPPTNKTYTVVAGDTLWAIARRFNTTVAAIKRLNNLTSDNLSIGQQLLIP